MNNSKDFKIARIIGIVEIILSLLLTVAGAFPVGIPLLLIGIFIVVGSRKAQRQFSLDRIVSLYDSGGNEIQNPKEYFLALYKQTPKYKTENALKEKTEQLSLLVFLARADGTMRKNEREIILKYLDSQIQGLDLDAAEKRVKSLQCDLRTFNQILKNAQQWPGAEKQMLLSCINQMYSLKKTPDPMEKAAFEKIKVSLSTN